MTGRANKSNVTMVETGFPGSPKNICPGRVRHDRFAGLNSSARERIRPQGPSTRFRRGRTCPSKRRRPAEANRSARPSSINSRSLCGSSGATGSRTGLRAGRLDLRAERVAVGIANLIRLRLEANIRDLSSPVASTAVVGRAYTRNCTFPIDAAMAMWPPRRGARSAEASVDPCWCLRSRGHHVSTSGYGTGDRETVPPRSSAYSTITTASAPFWNRSPCHDARGFASAPI